MELIHEKNGELKQHVHANAPIRGLATCSHSIPLTVTAGREQEPSVTAAGGAGDAGNAGEKRMFPRLAGGRVGAWAVKPL
jgi:hypothetical protein